jgi:hypothetical protein
MDKTITAIIPKEKDSAKLNIMDSNNKASFLVKLAITFQK